MSRNDDGLLKINQVSKKFGGLLAVHDVSCIIPQGKIVALLGPNGAGKTTLFNTIGGVYRPNSGSIIFDKQDISGKLPHVICKMGIARTFQIVRPFLNMTNMENVMVGVMFGSKKGVAFKEASEKAKDCLEFVGLAEKKDLVTGSLTLANRKKIELAKALASSPKMVLLDEILAGLNPSEVEAAMGLIRRIRDVLKITVFWVEHLMDAVINLAEHVIVLNYGQKIAEGSPQDIIKNPQVVDAYLGEDYAFKEE
jgi:branched-chain amino acid transport system ATP-binding protein